MLSGNKEKGDHKTECHDVTCPSVIDLPMRVRIRQNSSDGWGIEKMQVQRYPGSSEFITYSLNGSTQFWVDGDGGYDGDDSLLVKMPNGVILMFKVIPFI